MRGGKVKYLNGKVILPEELIQQIQNYAEGIYVYIPKRDTVKSKWGDRTNYRSEMDLRNKNIYDKYLEGVMIPRIADCYHLSLQSVRRIVLVKKREMEPVVIMIKELMKEWNIECVPCQIYHSAWEINEFYVLKVYENPTVLQRNMNMMQILHKVGIPVPEIIQLPDGREFFEKEGVYYLLTTKLKGKNIADLYAYKDKWFFEFGTILARLHLGFLECEKSISYWNNSMLEEMKGWVIRDLHKYNPEYLKWEDIESSIHGLEQIYEVLPNLGNFLFDNGTFSGYIDFDLSQSNIRVFDICYFLLGILLKGDNNPVEVDKWYEVTNQVIKGYHSLIPLSVIEKESIPCVMKNIELLFVAYFLGIGDEDSARNAADLFSFVLRNEVKIQKAIK